MDTVQLERTRAAFEGCKAGAWEAFSKHIEAELGSLSALSSFTHQDLRDTVTEFLSEHAPASALKKGKCVSELRDLLSSPPPAPASPSTSSSHSELRRRKQTSPRDAQPPEPEKKKGVEEEPIPEVPFKTQVCIMVLKTVLTLALFHIMHYFVSDYILKPAYQQEGPSVDDIIARLKAEGKLDNTVQYTSVGRP
eukprot:Sspe_Gene.50749::Locus_28232_Transcript_2_3_Confidence_0.333_Length_740::g.50749::m.50749